MFLVSQLLEDVQESLGTCDLNLTFRRLDAALDLIQPMLPTDSNIGVMDICVFGCEVTLPNWVETPLAINISGHPADFRSKWYEHHLNGVGTECCGDGCTFAWGNQGLYPTFRDLTSPSYLAAYSEGQEGTSIPSITIYGEDENGKPLYSCQGTDGVEVPGLVIPINYGSFSFALVENPVKIKRITQVTKPKTNSFVRLFAFDKGRPSEGTLIGYYRPDEQVPAYRRVKLSGTNHTLKTCTSNSTPSDSCCDPSTIRTTWARMRYQKRQSPITSVNDVIFVPSREAIINAVEAIHQYRANNKKEGDEYLGFARAALEEKQESLQGPNHFSAQYPAGQVYGGDGIDNMI